MPVNEKLMGALRKQYGQQKAERVYYAMESKGMVPGTQQFEKRHAKKARRRVTTH